MIIEKDKNILGAKVIFESSDTLQDVKNYIKKYDREKDILYDVYDKIDNNFRYFKNNVGKDSDIGKKYLENFRNLYDTAKAEFEEAVGSDNDMYIFLALVDYITEKKLEHKLTEMEIGSQYGWLVEVEGVLGDVFDYFSSAHESFLEFTVERKKREPKTLGKIESFEGAIKIFSAFTESRSELKKAAKSYLQFKSENTAETSLKI